MKQRGTNVEQVRRGLGRSFIYQFGAARCPQIWPRGTHNDPNWPTMPKNGNSKVPVVQNGWNSMERRWNGSKNFGLDHPQLIPPSFHTVPFVLDHQNIEIAFFWHFGRPRVKFWGTPLLQIAPKTSVWTSPNLFHLRSTLFQPFRTTGTLKLPCLGVFWPIWANMGAPGP